MIPGITKGKAGKPPRVLIYGTEGIGKSTFAAGCPEPIFVPTEDGIGEIDCAQFPLAMSYDDVVKALKQLSTLDHDYETVVIDSLDWLERLIFDKVCSENSVDNIEKAGGGYGKGYMLAVTKWRELLTSLDVLRNDRNMVVILLAHAKVERFEDPESTPYDRYAPRLHKHAAGLVCEWTDAVLFATRRMRVEVDNGAGFGRTRAIARSIGADGGARILRTVGGPACLAKNRYGVTADLPLSWNDFCHAITKG